MNDNVEKRIRSALAFTGYKVYNGTFTSTDKYYFVFLIDVVPRMFADDVVQYGIDSIALHFYCPVTANTVDTRKQVKLALQDAGFTYPSEVNASDEHMQHIVFEFQAEEYLYGEINGNR